MGIFSRLIQRARDRAIAQREAEAEALRLSQEAVRTVQEAITTSITPPDEQIADVIAPDASFARPQSYTKTRREIKSFRPDPIRSGGNPVQPGTQVVPGPRIVFQVTDVGVRYAWRGDFVFENAEYNFFINATNNFQVKLDGDLLIDESNSGPTRTREKAVQVTAGPHEVLIEWRPNGADSLQFNFTREFQTSWVSCVDGITRGGDPPETWIKTRDGCFKPPLPEIDGETVNLLEVLDLSPDSDARIERAYIKGSGTALQAHRLKLLNRSTNMTLNVRLEGPRPVRFVTARDIVGDVGVGGLPADSFELSTREEKLIDVVFVSRELDGLPEGLLRSDVLVGVAPGTITLSKDGDDNIDIGRPIDPADPIELPVDPPVDPPPQPPPTPTWRDCSGTTEVVRDGFPPSNFVLRADGCYVPEVVPPPKVSLVVSSVEFPAQFDGSVSLARANLRPTISSGRSAWTWRWNFDVNRQGSGTGNSSAQDPVVSWRMTAQDFRNLSSRGRTTRVVEAVATRKGGTAAGQIVRTTHTVILDDSRLRFPIPDEGEFDLRDIEGGRDDSDIFGFFRGFEGEGDEF